ncbi:hypothetical protein [Caballeronia sp. LZ016]|uniref:hypothetical protein n=1 Tax=Caballeronia sp. LZ016 TaxID=3038554 RepID=UPI002857C609|nr:hypothetical protein [Caballeronia sp. LZ016]MDR5739200.1 hypothetical protein [Caballeronia sp. LZ016]
MYRRPLVSFVLFLIACMPAVHAMAHDWPGNGNRHRWDEEERSHHSAPKARLYDARGTLVGDVLYVSGLNYDGGVALKINGVFVFAGFARIGGFGQTQR